MGRTRDDFSARTKNDLALRASYLCSICGTSTVGPSDESPSAVTMIGVAAHICAAAPGPGARRYDPSMTPEERSHIDNGIWLCANCGQLVDRDEERFPPDELRRIRREHEGSRRIGGDDAEDAGDIVAIGSGILAVGRVVRSGSDGTRVRISHFVEGSSRDLWSLAQDFDAWPADRRYALFNEMGYGGSLIEPPVVERVGRIYEVAFKLGKQPQRRSAAAPIVDIDRELGSMIEGMEAYAQIFETTLSISRGTWFANPSSGSDLSDLYWRYKGSPWFARLAMTEMIRLSSIPASGRQAEEPFTPLVAVRRVTRVEVPSFDLVDRKLTVSVEFDLEGLGAWERDLKVFVSTPEELAKGRTNARHFHDRIGQAETDSRPRRS